MSTTLTYHPASHQNVELKAMNLQILVIASKVKLALPSNMSCRCMFEIPEFGRQIRLYRRCRQAACRGVHGSSAPRPTISHSHCGRSCVSLKTESFLPGYVKVHHGTSGFHMVEQSILTSTCLTNEINVACVELHGLTCLTVFDILPTAASGTCCQATPFAWVTIASTPTIKWLHHLTLCASSDISRIGTVDQE